LPHHGGGQIALGAQAGDVRGEPELGERGDVVVEGEALF
jgi:hypothetical protein